MGAGVDIGDDACNNVDAGADYNDISVGNDNGIGNDML